MSLFKDFISLVFPQWCAGCMGTLVSGEDWLCTGCRSELLISNTYKERPNKISKKFFGKIGVEHAFTMFSFSKGGVTQNLLHRLKYDGYYELGVWLGNLYGEEIRDEQWISNIDFIVPIPLHKKKLTIRGYNQSESFSKGIAEVLEKPVNEDLYRRKHTQTQTRKSRIDRWRNVADIFALSPGHSFQGRNVLLIDDVITSGATLEAAGNVLKSGGVDRLYIATIASA